MTWMRRHLSYANVASTLALIMALGGTAYAGATLARNSVGSAQIKRSGVANSDIRNNAVTSAKVRNRSLRSADFAPGVLTSGPRGLTGPVGPTGPTGPQGTPGAAGADGTAAAFARVASTGGLDAGTPSQNQNIEPANVNHPAAGVYCFGGLPFTPRSGQVTIDAAMATTTSHKVAGLAMQRGNNLDTCPPTHQQARVTILSWTDAVAPALSNHGFYIWFEN